MILFEKVYLCIFSLGYPADYVCWRLLSLCSIPKIPKFVSRQVDLKLNNWRQSNEYLEHVF